MEICILASISPGISDFRKNTKSKWPKNHIFESMRRLATLLVILTLALFCSSHSNQQLLYFTDSGKIGFTSDAPLEVIKANSTNLAGILNLSDRSFSFSIPMNSFQGFNSALQKTHYNENYLETETFPKSTFNGKIIEEVNFNSSGTLNVRAKGKLRIHGIEQDRIIRCTLKIIPGSISVETQFTVPLQDHDITIPSIVQQKIAEVIDVSISFSMQEMK